MIRFSSIEKILTQIQQQPGWEEYQKYCQLLKCWQKTVTKNIFQSTRPLHIKRDILWVATSTSARAQELSFQRYFLLKKLNSQLPFSLKDIRFSTSGWNSATKPNRKQDDVTCINKSKKYASNLNLQQKAKRSPDFTLQAIDSKSSIGKVNEDPQVAVKRWIESIKIKSDALKFCPQCASPTPEVELKRWNLCHHCIAKKWSTEYRPPT